MDETENRKAFDKALNILSRRAHSSDELRKKLLQKNFRAEAVSFVISECERLNLVNDETFAEDYLNELKSKGYGVFKIKRALSLKGLDPSIINTLLETGNGVDEELDRAREALGRKLKALKSEKDPHKKKGKLFRFLASRGFSGQVISALLRGDSLSGDETE